MRLNRKILIVWACILLGLGFLNMATKREPDAWFAASIVLSTLASAIEEK